MGLTFVSMILPDTLNETRIEFDFVSISMMIPIILLYILRFALELFRYITLTSYWRRIENGRFIFDLNNFSIEFGS